MLEEYLKANSYARFHTCSYHSCREMHNNSRQHKILTKSVEHEMSVKGIWSWCVLEEYVKDNYYARFHTHSYRELHFNSRLDVNFAKASGARNVGQGHQVMVLARGVFQG